MFMKKDNTKKWKKICKRILKGKHLPVTKTTEISPDMVEHIISEQEKIRKAMLSGTLNEYINNNTDRQLSLDDVSPKAITVHTFSVKNGYYKDAIEWTEENNAFINKWIDRETNSLYALILFPNGVAENVTVTREIFEKVYDCRCSERED